MTADIEYALMAGASYISTRPDINKFAVPVGWNERTDKREDDRASGFEATYVTKGSEIVISFAGVAQIAPARKNGPAGALPHRTFERRLDRVPAGD